MYDDHKIHLFHQMIKYDVRSLLKAVRCSILPLVSRIDMLSDCCRDLLNHNLPLLLFGGDNQPVQIIDSYSNCLSVCQKVTIKLYLISLLPSQTMCAIEAQLESMLGQFHCEMKGKYPSPLSPTTNDPRLHITLLYFRDHGICEGHAWRLIRSKHSARQSEMENQRLRLKRQ